MNKKTYKVSIVFYSGSVEYCRNMSAQFYIDFNENLSHI